uniref:Putative secreted protein n=1 Tax=Ixodes ricinus TaxID=34613 RepID=A0A147BU76_IXORI
MPLSMFFFSCFCVCWFPSPPFASSQVVLFAHAAHAFATSLHQGRKVRSFRGLLASLSKVRGGGEGRMPSLCALCLGDGSSAFLISLRAARDPGTKLRRAKKEKSSSLCVFLFS